MKYVLTILSMTAFLSSSGFAGEVKEIPDSCTAWDTINSKKEILKVSLKLITTDSGKCFKYRPTEQLTSFDIFKVKGPFDALGKVEYCLQGLQVYFWSPGKDSYLLSKLIESNKLKPGYYAVRLNVIHNNEVPSWQESSNWIVIQVNGTHAVTKAVPLLKKASQGSEPQVYQTPAAYLGMWCEELRGSGRYKFEIQNVNGVPKVTSAIDTLEGEHLQVEISLWEKGVLTWKIFVPSTRVRTTISTVHVSSDKLECHFSNDIGYSGPMILMKIKDIAH